MAMEKWLDRLLDDWGWWATTRDSSGYRCRSIEGRYRPERVADNQQAPRVVNVQDCLAVERTICNPAFPAQARGLLKGWYVQRHSREKIAGRVGIPRSAFEFELDRAATMLKNRLDKSGHSSSIITATNPTDRDDCPASGGVRTTRETQARLA